MNVSNSLEVIQQFHRRKFTGPENYAAVSKAARQAYQTLSKDEVEFLVLMALTDDKNLQNILACLACLNPGCLKDFHQTLIEQEAFNPSEIYFEANHDVTSILIRLVTKSNEMMQRSCLLSCLAWAGNGYVQKQFSDWKQSPPEWVSMLYVPPHQYTYQAGWELLSNGTRQDLFFETTLPLVIPEEAPCSNDSVQTGIPAEQHCPWCERQLVSLLELDLTSDELAFLNLVGKSLRFTTCDVCACYGTLFSKVDRQGNSSWHAANTRPGYLPDDTSDWGAFPIKPLVLSGQERHFMESADWCSLPAINFSQVGGLPSWIQDDSYPDCPECSRKMKFVSQISNEDYEKSMEGIYYLLLCCDCNVTATVYQQS
ncbi:hypothetical protein [Gimesia sp.]|uniref:hypothetical protein n=1 Tax=Gimesia sp. TaxID=2024833 RepID=UPI003A93DF5C